MAELDKPLVGILMGSANDWPVIEQAHIVLNEFGIVHEIKALSAHRTPHEVVAYVEAAEGRGIEVLIGAAGGAAHLAGVISAHTVLPVLGIPVEGWSLSGLDSLLSTVQMPGGIPVGTLAVGKPGAKNAALLAVAILANSRPPLRAHLHAYRKKMAEQVLAASLPMDNPPGTLKA
jgi:5-(carboxyamino)imidazole ribonucleotide mutase